MVGPEAAFLSLYMPHWRLDVLLFVIVLYRSRRQHHSLFLKGHCQSRFGKFHQSLIKLLSGKGTCHWDHLWDLSFFKLSLPNLFCCFSSLCCCMTHTQTLKKCRDPSEGVRQDECELRTPCCACISLSGKPCPPILCFFSCLASWRRWVSLSPCLPVRSLVPSDLSYCYCQRHITQLQRGSKLVDVIMSRRQSLSRYSGLEKFTH